MILNYAKLGGAFLAASPILMQFGNSKATWWLGISFSIVAPFLLSVRQKKVTKNLDSVNTESR